MPASPELRSRNVETLIVDPFGRAFDGASQNDAGEVGAWLVDLDRFAREEVGALDLILAAHAGWNGERTRGSSALEDWADVIVTLTRGEGDDATRYLRASGRDVDLDEDALAYDPITRTLTMAGTGSRQRAKDTRKLAYLSVLVVRLARATPGIGVAELTKTLRTMDDAPTFRDRDVSTAAKYAVEQGLLRTEGAGPGLKSRHYAVHVETS